MPVTDTSDSLKLLLEQFIQLFQDMEQAEADKALAAEHFDIELLDQCMKKEQAFILKMKGYEKKRQDLLADLSISPDTHLTKLPALLPLPMQEQLAQTFTDLKTAFDSFYAVYQDAVSHLKKNGQIVEDELNRLQKLQSQISGQCYTADGTPKNTQSKSIKNIHI